MEVLSRFDIVGFDPRGVGLSTPVECISDEHEGAAHRRRAAADHRRAARRGLRPDRRRSPTAAPRSTATPSARSTPSTPRGTWTGCGEALGDEQLTYLGYSYGTTLGSTYAELFPDKVRALVLDAAVDPDADAKADAEASAAGLRDRLRHLRRPTASGLIAGCPIGANPRQFVDGPADPGRARPRSPAASSIRTARRARATAGVVMTAIQARAVRHRVLAAAGPGAGRGDRRATPPGLFSLADSYSGRLEDGTYSNLFDANLAVNCADTEEKFEEERGPRARRRVGRRRTRCSARGRPSASTPARCGRPSARRCPSATRRAARRSSSSATPATR